MADAEEQTKQEQFRNFLRQFVESLDKSEKFNDSVADQADRQSVLDGIQQDVEKVINDGDIDDDKEFNHILTKTTKEQLADKTGIDVRDQVGIYMDARRDANQKFTATGQQPAWSPGQQGGAKDNEAWRDNKYTEELTLYGEQDGKDQAPTNLNEIDDDFIKSALQDRWTVNGLVGMGVLEVDKDTGAIKAAEDDMTVVDAVGGYLVSRAGKLKDAGQIDASDIQGVVRSDVKGIQRMLNMQEDTVYGVDGKFGEETRATMITSGRSGEKLLGTMIDSEKAVSENSEGRAKHSPEGDEPKPGELIPDAPGQVPGRGTGERIA